MSNKSDLIFCDIATIKLFLLIYMWQIFALPVIDNFLHNCKDNNDYIQCIYITVPACFQSIQFTWKQVEYLASKMMLHRILHLLYFAILTQYFCSLCDISKTVFVIKWDYFDLHYRCYFSWCMLRLFVMKKGCVSYMFLWWICFWRKVSCPTVK